MSLGPGFADPVTEAHAVFRAAMDALARPGLAVALATRLAPPAPLSPELAAVALALADPDAPLWLDGPLAGSGEVAAYLRFHTGARIVTEPADCTFALISRPLASPLLACFAQGTDEYPDRSTTVALAVDDFESGDAIALAGPGIRGEVTLRPNPAPPGFAAALAANGAAFPCGVDCLLVAPGRLAGIPRSARVLEPA